MSDISLEDIGEDVATKSATVSDLQLPKDGIFLTASFLSKVCTGDKTLLIKSRPYDIAGEKLIISRTEAHGIIKISAPRKIDLEEFEDLESQHHITSEKREKFFKERETFWAYKIVSIRLFAAPIPIEPFTGPKVIVKDVELKTDKTPSVFELTKKEGDALLKFGSWLGVVTEKAEDWSESTLKFVSGPEAAISFIRGFPEKVGAFSKSISGNDDGDPSVSLPAAIGEAIKWGGKAARALTDEQDEFATDIREAVVFLKTIDKLMDSLEDVDSEPIVKFETPEA